jgi:hypothetical protein
MVGKPIPMITLVDIHFQLDPYGNPLKHDNRKSEATAAVLGAHGAAAAAESQPVCSIGTPYENQYVPSLPQSRGDAGLENDPFYRSICAGYLNDDFRRREVLTR